MATNSSVDQFVFAILNGLWTKRKTGGIVFLLLIYFSSRASCDDLSFKVLPLINRCCPIGLEYSVETDQCIKSGALSAVQYESETTVPPPNSSEDIKIYYVGHGATNDSSSEDKGEEEIRLPSELVIAVPLRQNSSEHSFGLNTNLPKETCTKGNFIVQLQIKGTSLNTNASNAVDLPSGDPPPRLTSRGELMIGNEYYSMKEYCLFGFNDTTVSARVCNATCSEAAPCIRKCCDLNEVFDLNHGGKLGCSESRERVWTPEFYATGKIKSSKEIYPHYKIVSPRNWCNRSYKPRVIDHYDPRTGSRLWRFRLSEDGVIFRRKSRYTWSKSEEYTMYTCIDGGINSRNLPKNINQSYTGLMEDEILFECNPVPTSGSKPQSILYSVLFVFSCFFLIITLAVYILLWNKQTVHGWTLMSYIVSLFFMYMFFLMTHISQFVLKRGPSGGLGDFCKFIGIGLNFFFISTFCWMSMINFDLWCTFKVLKPTGGKSKGIKRYVSYATFSTLVPVAIVGTAVTLDGLYGNDPESSIIVPEYGRSKCTADPEYAQLVYQYGPAGVLLIFNLIFFTITIFTMYQYQQSTKFATTSSSKNNNQRQSIKLFGKLLFVMGIPWVFEIISWFVERGTGGGNPWYWALFDVINILQAIAIFFIFVFKRDIIHSLEQKYPSFKAFLVRIKLDPESVEKFGLRFPFLKGIVSPFARSSKEIGSTGRSTHTDSTTASSESTRKGDIRMHEKA